METGKVKNRRFLAKILRVKKGKFVGDFLRFKSNGNNGGKKFSYSNVRDITSFEFTQIIKKVVPISFSRGTIELDVQDSNF